MKKLEEYLKLTQEELFDKLREIHKDNTKSIRKNGYLLIQGEAPIMLIAHLDTVHTEKVKHICVSEDKNILMSPQGIGGDDRCGVYALEKIYTKSKIKPWLLYTCDEEIGGKGASLFCEEYKKNKLPNRLNKLKMIVEIDRKGCDEAVYYQCGNTEFEKYITSNGFNTKTGSFSDISIIAPVLKIAAVNISAGYYDAHTQGEYINRKHLETTIKKVIKIVRHTTSSDSPKYEYVQKPNSYQTYYNYIPNGTSSRNYIPKGVPKKYRELYKILLDVYSADELEYYRNIVGDHILEELYDDLIESNLIESNQ